jgi:hypothetical protein
MLQKCCLLSSTSSHVHHMLKVPTSHSTTMPENASLHVTSSHAFPHTLIIPLRCHCSLNVNDKMLLPTTGLTVTRSNSHTFPHTLIIPSKCHSSPEQQCQGFDASSMFAALRCDIIAAEKCSPFVAMQFERCCHRSMSGPNAQQRAWIDHPIQFWSDPDGLIIIAWTKKGVELRRCP